ncbi:MAG: hypothetical protein Kow0079_17470 [Vicingaceae bacterium]
MNLKTAIILILFVFIKLNLTAQKCLHQIIIKDNGANNKALNSRSDTIDILNYNINLEILDFTSYKIYGYCDITFTPKINNINKIDLDLLKLTVDSVVLNNASLAFSYNDTLLSITFPTSLNTTDTNTIRVYYNGIPVKDASGWGGWYNNGTYAYNLGVGFQANPHNYGRVWHPCFDNFKERATYDFNILTSNNKIAQCNGYLVSRTTISGDTVLNTWRLDTPIPTYLACVAVAEYAIVHQTYNGMLGNIPIELAALPGDTTNLKNSFVNLNNALQAFENSYGPYKWNKVGYSLVPFNSGAMEHATNIAYPLVTANGNKTYETLMAHELSHHWWGDLTTCETAEDMWINEGMATYSEHLFLENVYGWDKYIDAVKNNHENVLRLAHIHENGYRAISGIPHEYTYGEHVYNKGASVAHNLRNYLGDSLFFIGLKAVLDSHALKTLNSYEMRDILTSATGINMNDFFNDWVFSPGFSHFSIDSSKTLAASGSTYDVTLYVKQKLKGVTNYHNNVPIEVSFFDNLFNEHVEKINCSGPYTITTVNVPFNPKLIILNKSNKLNQARTDNIYIKSTTGTDNNNLSRMTITVTNISDSALLAVEHHWVAPDPIKNNTNNYNISKRRYWSVSGILPSNFKANARVYWDGRQTTGYLDSSLVIQTEDSLILLYRKDAKDDWKEFPYYSKNKVGTTTPAFGYFTIDSLWLGEYTFANGVSTVLSVDENANNKSILVYPNPADSFITVKAPDNQLYNMSIYDVSGKLIYADKLKNTVNINTSNWSKGTYFINIYDELGMVYKDKFIIQ